MYIIDLFSRYTQADFIQSKCKDVFVSKIIELWSQYLVILICP